MTKEIDIGTQAAVRELEQQRAAVTDLLGTRAAELARFCATIGAERDALQARVTVLENEILELRNPVDPLV